MKALKLLSVGFCLLSCAQQELPPRVIRATAKPAACTIPKELDTKEKVIEGIDCLQMNIDNAFQSLKTKIEGEISVSELQKLQESGILEFQISSKEQWNGLSSLLTFLHPEGHAAISGPESKRVLSWLRTRADFLTKLFSLKTFSGKGAPLQPDFIQGMAKFLDELLPFFSDRGTMSLEQVESLVGLATVNFGGKPLKRETLSGAWRLKALLLESTRADDTVSSGALKKFLRVLSQIIQKADQSYRWWDSEFHPFAVPHQLGSEWQEVLDIAKNYFRDTKTLDLDIDDMRVQVQALFPEADFPERIPNLANVSRKLLKRKNETSSGILYGLLHLFDGGNDLFNYELRKISTLFMRCKIPAPCSVSSRTALANKELNPLTLLSAQDWSATSFPPAASLEALPQRKDGLLEWKMVLKRLVERLVVSNIFSAFDQDGNGSIPTTGTGTEDLKEATDIAYTVISIASSRDGTDSNDAVAVPILIKPSTVIGAIGLVGDRWVLPGNNDGKVNLSEFYSTLKVYEDVNYIAKYGSVSLQTYTKDPETARQPLGRVGAQILVDRKAFISNFGSVYQKELPYLISVFKKLDKSNGGAATLLDALVPEHKEKLTLYEHGNPSRTATIDYIEREDMLRPVSILVLLDRLILKCDSNEDEHFDWAELDCVSPLVLEAGETFLNSGIMSFPPLVAELGALTAQYLGKKGLPYALTKTILLNGSTSQISIPPAFISRTKNNTTATAADISDLFEGLSSKGPVALREEISQALGYQHGVLRRHLFGDHITGFGPWRVNTWRVVGESPWDKVCDLIITRGILPDVKEKTYLSTPEIWRDLSNPDTLLYKKAGAVRTLLPLAMVLGSKPEDWILFFNQKRGDDPDRMDPISPANLLSLLEGFVAD